MTPATGGVVTLVDAHVHFQHCFAVGDFLAAACRNFRQVAHRVASRRIAEGVLVLTESRGVDWYAEIARPGSEACRAAQQAGWRVLPTREPEALRLQADGEIRLYLIRGRQVVTAERMEVLWLGTTASPPDGEPMTEVIDRARADGAVPIIPWGFGKWLGRRGRHLRALLQTAADARGTSPVHLGDNGGRPYFWPLPAPIRRSTGGPRRNLPGSDPLPFADEIDRPGSYGFWFEGRLNPDTPATHLKSLIEDPAMVLAPYGKPERALRFLRHQIAMQLRLRTTTRTPHQAA